MGEPLVFVTVGTDHHRFDRLISWAERWARDRRGQARVVVQHGFSRQPEGVEAVMACTGEEMTAWFTEAAAVVSAAGPGTIMDALAVGIRPVVVPRRARFGEIVDDHQAAFARHVAKEGIVVAASSEAELRSALDRALRDPSVYRVDPGTRPEPEGIARIGELVDRLVWES